jgi:hypothetical protein
LLFLHVVEAVDHDTDTGGEVVHATAELVVAGEIGALGGEAAAFVL